MNINEDQSLGSKVTLLLDENSWDLKDALRDAKFKVITFDARTPDDVLNMWAEATLIVTKNAKDFRDDIVIFNYDIINLEHIKFFDGEKTRKNKTVTAMRKAINESGILHKKGNFELTVYDDGSFKLKQHLI